MGPFDVFKKLGDDIKRSNQKIGNDIKKSNQKIANDTRNIPKPKIDMKALQTASGVIAGIVSLTPMGKALVAVSVGIADSQTHGAGSNYLNNGHKSNGTLSLLPGGMLLQTIANESSGGKSGEALTQYVPDPKKSAIQAITNRVEQKNIVPVRPPISINAIMSQEKRSTLTEFTSPIITVIPKPNIFHNVIAPTLPVAPVLQSALHRIAPHQKTVLADTIIQKKTIFHAIVSPIIAPIIVPVVAIKSSLGVPVVPIITEKIIPTQPSLFKPITEVKQSSSLPVIPIQSIVVPVPDRILPTSSLPMQPVTPVLSPILKTTLLTNITITSPTSSTIQEKGTIGDYLPFAGLGLIGLFFLL